MELVEKSIVFVTGKGGVGKTTVALALGRYAADAGKRAIVCELSGQNQAAEVLGLERDDYAEVEAGGGLHAISIDPQNATREYLEHRLPMKAMSAALNRSKLFNYLAAATPGLAEMVALGKVWELAGSERRVSDGEPYDLVIVDSPATGHGIGLLETPRNFAEIARVGPLAEQASVIDRALRDPERSAVAVVATPEEMAVTEALEIIETLRKSPGIEVGAAFANSLVSPHLSADEVELVEKASPSAAAAAPALAAVASRERRILGGRAQLDRLRAEIGAPLVELPLLSEPALDADSIVALAGAMR